MEVFTTKGVILKSYKIGEADRLLITFTEKKGKIPIVAKAVRRPKSRLAGHLQDYRLIELTLASGRSNYYRLTGALDKKKKQDHDFETVSFLEMLGETIDLALAEEEANSLAFSIFTQAIKQIEDQPSKAYIVTLWSLINLLSSFGFSPELAHCTICRDSLTNVVNGWSSSNGGVVCHDCLSKSSNQFFNIDQQTIFTLRSMRKEDFASLEKTSVETLTNINQIIIDYLITHLGRPLKSINVTI